MTPDELQALLNQRNQSVVICHCGSGGFNVAGAQVLSIVPRAAALYDRQISRGLDGDPEATVEARLILKELIPDRIRLTSKPDGTPWPRFGLQPAALLAVPGSVVGMKGYAPFLQSGCGCA